MDSRQRTSQEMGMDFIYVFQSGYSSQNYGSRVFRISRRLHEFMKDYAIQIVGIRIPAPDKEVRTVITRDAQKIGKAMLTQKEALEGSGDMLWKNIQDDLRKKNIETDGVNLEQTWRMQNLFLHGGSILIQQTGVERKIDPSEEGSEYIEKYTPAGSYDIILVTNDKEINDILREAQESIS